MDALISLLSIAAPAALFLLGIGCGARLFEHWRKSRNAGKRHYPWQRIWIAGWVIILVALLALLFPATRGGLSFIAFVAPPLWIIAYVSFRRAQAQEAVPPPRYDDPQEGVWPPPPANSP